MHFFTYSLFSGSTTLRKGKGLVRDRRDDAVHAYLNRRYPNLGWDRYTNRWHSTESAAFKTEHRAISSYERATGRLPPWNARAGRGGGRVFARCVALMRDGRECHNLALAGNRGFCGVHRR